MTTFAIAGAGLLGRLAALMLSRAGHRVDVFDPLPGSRAPGAAGRTAAGMLSPVAELESADADVQALGWRSIALWRLLVASLGPDHPVEFDCAGSLMLAHRTDLGAAERVLSLLRARTDRQHAPRALDAAALKALEPAVHGPAHAWLLENEGRIHTVQAMDALHATARARGVRFHWSRTVRTVDPGMLHLDGGERVAADCVLDVRGTGARSQLPVRGVRGEIFHLHAPGVTLNRPLRLLHPRHRVYIVPRQGEHVVVGASEIESEDRSPVSVRSTVELLSAAHSVVPALAEARVVHTETNLRPALPDNLPRVSHAPGLLRVNGLFRHGWLVAPALLERAFAPLDIAFEPLCSLKED